MEFIPGPASIVKLILKIREAVNTAQQNKEECTEILKRVEVVGMYVEGLRALGPQVSQNQLLKKVLSRTEETLEHACRAIENQQRARTPANYLYATDTAKTLTDLKEKISYWGHQINLAIQLHGGRLHANNNNNSRPCQRSQAQVAKIARVPNHPNPRQPPPPVQVVKITHAPNHRNPRQPPPLVVKIARVPNHPNPRQPPPLVQVAKIAHVPNHPNPHRPLPPVAKIARAPNHPNPRQPPPPVQVVKIAHVPNHPNPRQPPPLVAKIARVPDHPNPRQPPPPRTTITASSNASHVKRPDARATIPGAAAGYSAVTQTPSAPVLRVDKDRRRRKLLENFKEFRLSELQDATNYFSTAKRIGNITIYKGILADGSRIALRRFGFSSLSYDEIVAEIKQLAIFDHANIVRCIGFNLLQETILVYEDMPEERLDTSIHYNRMHIGASDLSSCLRIIKGIAEGVAFVHSNIPRGSLLHGYLLPCNILLDSSGNPKITDIGISNILEKSTKATASGISQSITYSAPELVLPYSMPSKESYVYTFGVIALETITGMNFSQEGESGKLPLCKVWRRLSEYKTNADQNLSPCMVPIQRCILVAMSCVHKDPAKRPSMIDVLDLINGKR